MDKSLNLEEEVMPSFFKSLKSKESSPLTSWQEVERQITQDAALKGLTLSYRKRLAISKQLAKEIKWMSPAISISVQFNRYGRSLEDMPQETCHGMLDLDLDSEQQCEEVFAKAISVNLSECVYRTISGKGIRIFFRYERPVDCQLSMVELHAAVTEKAINFYELLLGVKVDRQCLDFAHLAGLASDPKAYFHWHATPITLSEEEVKAAEKKAKAANRRKPIRRKSPSGSIPSSSASKGAPTMQEAAPHIQQLLEQWGILFEPGNHNSYVSTFGYTCLKYDIPYEEVCDFASEHFSHDYPEALGVIKSCYKKTSLKGTWHFRRKGEKKTYHPSVRQIKQWLSMHYEFKHNLITGSYEVKSRILERAKFPHWMAMETDDLHSIWAEMDEDGISISDKKLTNIIESDFSEKYDPLKDYLMSLAPWDGKTDYIAELANRVTIDERDGFFHDQETFVYYFKKWLVGMVVGWVTDKVVNQVIMIFVGKGGIFKTTFFANLLPEILQKYFMNESTYNYTDKDSMESLSSKALICFDEFEPVYGKNSSAFKSNVTKQTFSIRRPYARFRSELVHRGALCATSNTVQVITEAENRRFCPWIVKNIVSPLEKPFNHEGIYAQAVALGKQVIENRKAQKMGEWVYWLTSEDIQQLKQHNELFMVANFLKDQITRFYKVPTADTPKNLIKFRYNSEILERICTNPAMRQNVNTQSIGSVMASLGFPSAHRRKGNGWWVVEKDGIELKNDAAFDPGIDVFPLSEYPL